MKYMMTSLIAALFGIMLAMSQTFAQSNDPEWLNTVTIQLDFEKNCEVGYFIFARESELAGRIFYEARAQCQDGRQFDATRTGDNEAFKIKACEQTAIC